MNRFSRARSAFTLVELLVVVAIIALLISIILPGLANAKKTARMTREMSAGKQQVTSWQTYALDQKDRVVPAGPAWDSVHPGTTPYGYVLRPTDPFPNAPVFMEGSVSKTWVWHLYTATGYALNGLQIDTQTYDNFRNRPTGNSGVVNGWAQYADTSAQAAFGYHPTFGMNAIYVGGAHMFGAHSDTGAPNWSRTNNNGGRRYFYVRSTSDIRNSKELMVFASARGGDVSGVNNQGTTFWQYTGNNRPDTGIIRPGFWGVMPPRPYPVGRVSASISGPAWNASDKFDSRLVPSTWGNLDGRHFGKIVNASADGHVDVNGIGELRDMRKWSNYADRPDWAFVPGR